MIKSIEPARIFSGGTPRFDVKFRTIVEDIFIKELKGFFEKKEIEVEVNAFDGLDNPITISLQGETLTKESIMDILKEFKMLDIRKKSLRMTNGVVDRIWPEKKGY